MTAFTFKDKNILIIEDQRPFLMLLRGLLQSLGAKDVTTCASAEKAANLCRKNVFDIIISDLHLGIDRKNGFELIEELRIKKWLKPQSIFIIISADSARPMVMGSVERRPDDYLVKPFSQAQLKSRIIRAWNKRQFLAPIFVASDSGQLQQAIDITIDLINTNSNYKNQCLQILIDLYWRTQQYDPAMALFTEESGLRSALWAQVARAKTQLALKQYNEAINSASILIKKNKFCVEAYDLLADAQSALNQPESAILTIQDALKISPFNLERQFTASRIAREFGDYELVTQTCLSIWEQSKRSVHQSSLHWCGYIRSLLEAAEKATEKKFKNKYQQEALLAMQRSKFDDTLARINDDFDIKLFEDLINARINVIDGKLIEAKRILSQSQLDIDSRFSEFPAVYAPDSIHTLLKIGEYEEAILLQERLNKESTELDPNSTFAIEQAKKEVKDKQGSYAELNRKGIKLYQEGKFVRAKGIFEEAQDIAPVNTGVALNLLQCLLKIIQQSEKKKVDPQYARECRKVFRVVDGMPLSGQHLQKFETLCEELLPLIN